MCSQQPFDCTKQFGKGFHSLLIGIGTSICGSAAIVASSQFIAKEKKDITLALTTVNIAGLLGLFVLPTIICYVGLEKAETAILLGGSLQSVAHVVASGFVFGDEVGKARNGDQVRAGCLASASYHFPGLSRKEGKFKKMVFASKLFVLSHRFSDFNQPHIATLEHHHKYKNCV